MKRFIQSIKPTFLILFILSSNSLKSQIFQRSIGGSFDEYASKMINAIDGGYLILGSTASYGNDPGNTFDGYLVKTDSLGHVLWTKTYGGLDVDQLYWIEPYNNNSYLICGQTNDLITGYSYSFVGKIDLYGNLIWQKNYKIGIYETANCISITSDGGFLIGGECEFNSDEQALLLKADSSGNLIWSKAYGSTFIDAAQQIVQTSDGGMLISGTSRYGFYSTSLLIIKTDSAGNQQWSKKYNTSPAQRKANPAKIFQLASGGYIISGNTTALGLPLADVFLIRLDDTGNIIWQKVYNTNEQENARDMIIDEDGGYVICGSTAINSSNGYYDAMIMKTDSSGNLLSNFLVGIPTEDETAVSFLKNGNGNYVVAGDIYGQGQGETDFFLFETAKDFDTLFCNSSRFQMMTYTPPIVASALNYTSSPSVFVTATNFTESYGGGETELCDLTSGVDQIEVNSILLYPNPASNSINLKLPDLLDRNIDIRIYDVYGQLVIDRISILTTGELSINIESLSQGIYYLNLFNSDNSKTFRFIKQN